MVRLASSGRPCLSAPRWSAVRGRRNGARRCCAKRRNGSRRCWCWTPRTSPRTTTSRLSPRRSATRRVPSAIASSTRATSPTTTPATPRSRSTASPIPQPTTPPKRWSSTRCSARGATRATSAPSSSRPLPLRRADSEPEELVDADDRRIGRAFRVSIWIIGAVIAVGLITWLGARAPRPAAPVQETVLKAPLAQDAPPVAPAPARFTDVTRASGVAFVHRNGAYGEKLLPETMGGGVAVIDVRGNGRADLLFVDSGAWPWKGGGSSPMLALYLNDGKGRFTEATAGSGLDGVRLYGMGIAVGDFDNDGFDDIAVTGVGGVRLLRNLGGSGKFEDVTKRAGIRSAKDDWYTCA